MVSDWSASDATGSEPTSVLTGLSSNTPKVAPTMTGGLFTSRMFATTTPTSLWTPSATSIIRVYDACSSKSSISALANDSSPSLVTVKMPLGSPDSTR